VKVILLLVFAAVIAVGPAFHHHPLIPKPTPDMAHATNFCAACVAATARITTPGPAISTPVVVALVIAPIPQAATSADAPGPVPSRAPPLV